MLHSVTDFIFLGSKITADGDCSHEIKRRLLLGRKAMTNPDSVLKQRHHFADKGLYRQSYGFFPSSHVQTWELDRRRRQNAEELMLLNCGTGEDSWESLGLQGDQTSQSILNEINLEYSLEGLLLQLTLQYFGHLMWRADSLGKTQMLKKIEGKRRRGWQRMREIASLTQWTWTWANSGI